MATRRIVGGRHVADRARPFRRIGLHMVDEMRRRPDATATPRCVVVSSSGPTSMPSTVKRAFERRIDARRVERHGAAGLEVDHQRLARVRIAQEEAVRADQIGRRGAVLQERQVEPLARMLVQQHVDHGEQEGDVGLRLDRDPLGRAGAGDRQMRLDLHALHAALARVGVALDPAHAARGLDIGAERQRRSRTAAYRAQTVKARCQSSP